MKKNDYIIASINNPDFTAEDFRNVAGYSLKDTLMLKEEDYLSNDFIKSNPLFLDSSGTFREEKFKEFYKLKLKDFGDFSNEDFADNYLYSPFDTRRRGKDKILPFGVTFFNNPNPTMLSIGIEGPNELGLRTFSDREIAQKLKIFDTKSGSFLDYSPNDLAFTHNPFKWIKSLVEDPLVLAIYDEAGEHIDPITKRKVKHNKGDKKLNANGLPYYERLNGRSLIGRDILASTDVLTVDGDIINKYDFLDSDDLDKSISGVIAKTTAAILPLFTPAAPYYGTLLMLRELAKTAPMLYGMGTALFSDEPDSYVPNTIAAYANKLTTSTSDYSKERTFTLENFGSLIADVALQWEQLHAVIRAFNKFNNATNKRILVAKMKALNEYEKEATALINESKLGKIPTSRVKDLTGASNTKELKELIANGKWELTNYGAAAQSRNLNSVMDYIRHRTLMGQDLSLGYMALISNTDVYLSAIEHGADKKEAAALALGSTAGMFVVDKWLGLGEMFFQVPEERQIFRSSIRNEAKQAIESLLGKSKEGPNVKGFFKSGTRIGKKVVQDFRESVKARELPILGKALGEGLEEMSEELVTDLVKSAGLLAADFGWISGPDNLGAWENMGDRYLMSMLGGTLGGGIFGVKLKITEKRAGKENQEGPKQLLLLIRQGKTNEVRRELNKMHEAGLLGRTDLSIEYLIDSDNKKVFLTPDEKHISQNDYIYNIMSQSIDLIQSIIEGERLGKTEDDLFKLLVLKDERYMRLLGFLLDKSYLVGYQQRYQDLVQAIIAKRSEIDNLESNDSNSAKNKSAIDKAKQELADKELERDKFLSGELSLDYLRELNFIMNPLLTKGFVPLELDQFAVAITGSHYDSLDKGAQWNIYLRHLRYLASKDNVKSDIKTAYKSYSDLTTKLAQPLLNYLEAYKPSYEFWDLEVEKLEKSKEANAWTWDDKLEGEDDESYENRDTPMEGESDIAFLARLSQRQDAITKHNENIFNYWKLALALNTYIDSTTKRRLSLLLEDTETQIKKELIRLFVKDPDIGKEILAGTKPEDVLPKLRALKESEIRDKIWEFFRSPDFTFTKFLTGNNKETGEPEYQAYNATITNGTELSDDLKAMLIAQERLMDDLGMGNTFDIRTLYEALGPDPINTFYQKYNAILEQLRTDPDNEISLGMFTLADIAEATNHPIANMLIKYGEGLAAIDPNLSEDERKRAISDLELRYAIPDIRETTIEALVAETLNKWETKEIQLQAYAITNALETDSHLQLLQLLKNLSVLKSPGDDILNMIVKSLGDEDIDFVKMLEDLGSRWSSQQLKGEFEITPDEKDKLVKSKELIEEAKSLIAGMYRESYLGDSMSYNKSINEFVRAHKEVQENWEDLPTIETLTGLSIYHSLEMFLDEIDEWIEVANKNSDNKIKSIQDAKNNYDAALLDLLFTTIGKEHWLLEGYDGSSNMGAEVTLYNNVQKALKTGKTTDDILKELIDLVGSDSTILTLKTSDINSSLSSGTFTAYDRLLHLITWASINKADYLKAEQDFLKKNPKVAYLPTLEPAMLYSYALKHNPNFIYAAIDKMAELARTKGLNMPPIYGLICTGIGGAGKTKAVAAFSYDESESTWISGPTKEQLTNLKSIAPTATGKSREELIKYITGGNTSLLETKIQGKGLDGATTLILPDISDKLVTTNAPKHLIIDEVTHYSNLELQAISLWAKKAGVRLTLLGDENQKGHSIIDSGHFINNITREVSIGLRTPRLAISLRTANLWKSRNQQELVYLMNKLRNADDDESSNKAKDEVLEALTRDFQLSYWEDPTNITGDKITSKLSDDDIERLLDKKVAYIGTNPESVQSKLKDVKVFKDLQAIQGLEFDYVIVDSILGKIGTENPSSLLDGLRDLYTAISRSKEGTIIIDGKLRDLINIRKLDYTTLSINLSPEIIELLNSVRFLEIEQELSNIPLIETDKPPVTPPKKSKESIDLGENPEEEFNGEFRAYSNINFLGGVERESLVRNWGVLGEYKVNNWKASGLRKDIGIFGTEGYLAKTPDEKAELVYALACLRSIFTFNKFTDEGEGDFLDIAEFNKLPKRVLDLFDGDPANFRKVKYYVVSEDYDPNVHSLIGNTTASNDQVSFMQDSKGTKLVISVQARIPDKDGNILTITLGAVANPDTWENAINKREVPTNPKELKEFNERQLKDKEALKEYRKDLKDLVESKEKEIDKPRFTGQTLMIKLDSKIALGDIYGGISEWEKRTRNFTVSPVYAIIDNLKDINPALSEALKGRPVVFVSADPTLSSERLADIWKALLLNRETNTARVRMLVLDNKGVSFKSLYRHTFSELYRTSFTGETGKDTSYDIPFNLEAEAVRIFLNTWNYRANLTKFNKIVDSFIKELGWTLEELENKVKKYNDLYNEAKLELNSDNSKKKSLSDELFYKWLQEHSDKEGVQDTITIRKFNLETLKDTREFRLGYSKDGAYIGRLYGASNTLYEGDANGIYISPTLAILYEKVLKNYFTALINPVFELAIALLPQDLNIVMYSKNTDEKVDKWFDLLQARREVTFATEKGDVITVPMPESKSLNYFSYAIIKTPENLRWKALKGRDRFERDYNQILPDGKLFYRIKLFVNGEFLFANYKEIDDPFKFDGKSGILTSSNTPREGLIGEIPVDFETEDGIVITRYVDTRMDTFLSLMFHGIVAEEKHHNFENSNQLYATDALFKHGIFIDSELQPRTGNEWNYAAQVKNNKALFVTDAIPGGPLISFTFDKAKKEKEELPPSPPPKVDNRPKSADLVEEINRIIGKELLDPKIEHTKQKILSTLNSNNAELYASASRFDPTKILFISDDTKVVSLLDKELETHPGLDNTEAKVKKDIKTKLLQFFTVNNEGTKIFYIISKEGDNYVISPAKLVIDNKSSDEAGNKPYTTELLFDDIIALVKTNNPENPEYALIVLDYKNSKKKSGALKNIVNLESEDTPKKFKELARKHRLFKKSDEAFNAFSEAADSVFLKMGCQV